MTSIKPDKNACFRYAGALVLFLFFVKPVSAQELRRTAFSFLNVNPSARVTALGGVNVSLTDRDPAQFFSSPALFSDTLAGFASANYQFYVGDIGHASFSYLPSFKRTGAFAVGVDHFSYGSIDSFDPTGNPLGSVNVSETAIVISKNHQVRYFRLGVSAKAAFSTIAGFRSSAVMFDVGGVFIHPDRDFRVGLVLKNAGFIMSDYTGGSDSRLPIDLQAGATFKPEHMPFRFSLTAYRLIQSEAVEYTSDGKTDPATLQKVLRHFNFGAELLLSRNVNILFGYNYGIHQELKLADGGGSAGITYGFSARIKTVEFAFGRSTYVAGSAGYSFSLASNVNRFF